MDGAVAEAYKKLEEAMKDQNDYRRYWAHRKYEHDMVSRLNYAHDKGIEQGKEEGLESKATEIARKLKARGRPIDEIIADTGLSEEAVQKL